MVAVAGCGGNAREQRICWPWDRQRCAEVCAMAVDVRQVVDEAREVLEGRRV